jgi:hypothetical protein
MGIVLAKDPPPVHQSEDGTITALLDKYLAKHQSDTQLTCKASIFSLYVISTVPNSVEFVIDVQPEYGPITAFKVGPPQADRDALFALLTSAYLAHEPVLISFLAPLIPSDIATITGVYLPPEHYHSPTASDCAHLNSTTAH